MAILYKFFGLLPGQTRQDFINEVKALTDADKAELIALIAALA